MKYHILHREQFVKTSLNRVWEFFSNPHNLALITPPEMNFKILSPIQTNRLYKGMLIEYSVKPLGNFSTRWITEISNVKENDFFIDNQLSGPFKEWNHLHTFVKESNGVWVIDDVKYELPLGVLGNIVHFSLIRNRLLFIFDFRKKVIEKLFN